MESLTVVELRNLAKEARIPGYSKMIKRELISHLSRCRSRKESYLNTYTSPISYSISLENEPITYEVEDSFPEIGKHGYLVFGIKPPKYTAFFPDIESTHYAIQGAYFVEESDWYEVQRYLSRRGASRLYTPRSLFDISQDYVRHTFNKKILQKSRAIPACLM